MEDFSINLELTTAAARSCLGRLQFGGRTQSLSVNNSLYRSGSSASTVMDVPNDKPRRPELTIDTTLFNLPLRDHFKEAPRPLCARSKFTVRPVARLASPPPVIFKAMAKESQLTIKVDSDNDEDQLKIPRFSKKALQARNERRTRSTRHARRLIKRVEDGRSENPDPLHGLEKEGLNPEFSALISATLPKQASPMDGGSPPSCSSHSRASWNALVSFPGHTLLSENSVHPATSRVSEDRYPTPPRSESPSQPSFPSPTLTSPSSSLRGPLWSLQFPESTSCSSEPSQLVSESEQAMTEVSYACSPLSFGPMMQEEDIDRYELGYPD